MGQEVKTNPMGQDSHARATDFQCCTTANESKPLHPRATDHVALSDNMIAGDIFQRRATAQRHGDLELIPQHLQCIPHPCLAVYSKGEQYRPSNLTEDKHERMMQYMSTNVHAFSQSNPAADLQILLRLPVPRP